jgi:putative acetyltransferase
MNIVDEHRTHQDAIRRVVGDAFGRGDEARLVDNLRNSGDLAISLVAEEAGRVCGHVALSRLRSPAHAFALAPLSVLRSKQGQGVGSALVRQAIERARDCGCEIIFVLGEPDYYGRFGFATAEAAPFACQYAGPYFMALNLTRRTIPPASLVYPDAFGTVE